MSATLWMRAAAAACACLLAGVVAVAVAARTHDEPAPEPPVARATGSPAGGWYAAAAGVGALPPAKGRRSPCGLLERATLGVIHPTLQCGAKVFVAYGGRTALSQVVAHDPVPAGREFDLTPALADRLHLDGVRRVRWAYARAAE